MISTAATLPATTPTDNDPHNQNISRDTTHLTFIPKIAMCLYLASSLLARYSGASSHPERVFAYMESEMPFLVNTRKTALPGQSFFARIIFHFFLLLLVIFSFSASAGKSSLPTNAECKNLAKVNDIDDLLYQLYSNLDSHCLFDMDTAELEKIWGIRVFDLNSAPYASKEYYAVISEMNEFDKTEEAFYVVKVIRNFTIDSSFEIVGTPSYYDKHNGIGGEISQGRFPKYLPPPHIWEMPGGKFSSSPPPPLTKDTKPMIVPNNCVYKPYHYYYWIHDKNRPDYPIMLMRTLYDPISGRVIFARGNQSIKNLLPL